MSTNFESRKRRIYDYIVEFQVSEGRSPSYREILNSLKIPSLKTVQTAVKQLVEDGALQIDDSDNGIAIPEPERCGDVKKARICGDVICGIPEYLDSSIQESVYLPTSIFGDDDVYLLVARGVSMIDFGIYPGDILVVNPYRAAYSGDVVLARIPGEGTTCKIFMQEGRKVFLRAANDSVDDNGERVYPDIYPDKEEGMEIIGLIDKIISDPRNRRHY